MNSDKQSAKNGKSAPKRRISALQKVAGSNPAGSDVGSSLDDFIATANQTLTDTDAFKLTADITGESQKKKEKEEAAAAMDAAAAATAAEVARVAAEEAARKVLAEVTRKSAQQVAQLEAKLAQAEARASSVERMVRAPRAPSPLPFSVDEGADFAEGSLSQSFGLVALRRRRTRVLKAIGIVTGAVVLAGGVFLVGNGRLWNKPAEPKAEKAAAVAATPAKTPAIAEAAPAPAVSALPAEAPAKAEASATAPAAKAPVKAAAPTPVVEPIDEAPAPVAAAPQPQPAATPMVSSLAPTTPTVTPLDGDGDRPARKSSKKKKSASHKAASGKSGGKKPSGGIVDPFAQ